jgi:hypothetical protein
MIIKMQTNLYFACENAVNAYKFSVYLRKKLILMILYLNTQGVQSSLQYWKHTNTIIKNNNLH